MECSKKVEKWVFWVQVILKRGFLAKIESKINGRYLVDILERHWKNSTINESTTTTCMKWYKHETTNNMRFEKVINTNQFFYDLKNATIGSLVTSKHGKIYFIGNWGYGIDHWKFFIKRQERHLKPKIVHRKERNTSSKKKGLEKQSISWVWWKSINQKNS